MAELSELQRKYGADGSQLTPDAAAEIMRKEMFRVKSPQETAQAILKGSSPELVPEPNVFQRMGRGAGIAGELANKYLPKALVLPQKYVEPSPLINAVRDVDVPTSLKMYPTVDTTTGEMIPSGFGEERVKLGKIADAIKPADLLGLTGTQKTYEALGYGQAPEPLDVLDTLGMHASLTGLGKAGFRGLSSAARVGAPYAAEGLTNLVSKYGADPRMNITPEAPSMSGALPAGMKLEQEGNQFVLYDASGKIFSRGPDANSVVFKANKRLENEAANAAKLARREAAAEAAPVVEAKPEVKVETDPEAPLFYNPLLKAAANLEEKTDPLEILNDLKSFENVSKDQIEYSGIEDYLKAKANTDQPVTKQQIIDFVNKNKVELVEHKNTIGEVSPDQLEIKSQHLEASEPDDYHLEDEAQYYEDMAREEGEVDYIFNDLRQTFDPDVYSDAEIMDMANEQIKERALKSARDAYYDNPEYHGSNDIGYKIFGNDDMGWYLTDPNGRPIAENQSITSIEEANDFIQQHALEEGYVSGSPVKFGPQTHPAFLMPGGSNYREINTAVTPVSMFKQSGRANFLRERIAAGNDRLMEIRTQYPAMIDRPPEIQKEVEELTNMRDTAEEMLKSDMQEVYDRPDFTDHFDEPDIVSQLRAQDFRDVDGKTGVLGDEIQSDLHQKGRDQGYRGSNSEIKAAGEASSQAHANFQEYASTIPQLRGFGNFRNVQTALRRANSKKLIEDNIAVSNRNLDPSEPPIPPLDADPNIDEKLNNLKELLKDYDEKNKAYSKIDSPIPDAPFKKDYYQISLRRLIKEAIDGGKDRVYIPNGEVVADRYNYARAIENIAYKMNDDGTYNIAFKPFGNNNYIQNIGNQSFSRVEESKLAGILGKDMAEKLKSGFKSETQETYSTEDIAPQQTNVINNADITVGGKGFKQYYDENYPNFLKKEAEEFGAETGYTKIPTPANHYKQRESIIRSEARKRKMSTQEFEQQLNRLSRSEQEDFFTKRTEPVFYLEINDAMRKAYGKGRPYARGGYVTDAVDSVDDHFDSELKNYRAGGLVKMEKGGVPKSDSEASNIEPIPLLGRIAEGLSATSDFLKSRPLKEEGTREARGATSAINNVLELADSFFVNDLAKTADRIAYGFPVTSGSGQTTQMLPETVGAVSTVLPMAGKVVKPIAKAVRKVAPDVAETAAQMAERYAPTQMYAVPPGKTMSTVEDLEAAKQRFLEQSAEKRRMYHGSSNPNITEFKTAKTIKNENFPDNAIEPWATDNRDAVFISPEPKFSEKFSGVDYDATGKSDRFAPTTYPVHVQIKTPFDFENEAHRNAVKNMYKEMYPLVETNRSGYIPSSEYIRHHTFDRNIDELDSRDSNWPVIENAQFQDILKALGHDSFYVSENGIKNLGVYDPKRIKSAIGNEGTYDITNPDMAKARGGAIHMAKGGSASQEFPIDENAGKAKELSPLERQTSEAFGMLPREDRLSVLPRFKKDDGFIAPEFIYDLAKAVAAPRTAMSNELSEEDAFNVALNIVGGKPAGKVIRKVAPEVAETAAQMAERYAPTQMYAIPPGKRMSRAEAEAAGLWHPISNVKLEKPYSEMTATAIDNPAVVMAPKKILTTSDLLGKTGIQLVGDRAATGKILTEINDVPLEWPVPLTGGGKYSMANLSKDPNKSAAWESGKGVVTKLQDQIDMAANEGSDVLGIFSAGSLQQVDFNSMMSSALAAQLKNAKISKEAAKEFNEEMHKFVPKFVGINSPKLKEQILDKSNGVLRTKLVELMESDRFRKMGFPDVPSTRKAITDLEYLDTPLGTTGLVINKMDKNRRIVTPKNPSDYPISMGGQYYGQIEGGLPYQTMFSTLNKQRRLLDANPAGDYRSYTQSKSFQKFDNEWQDTVEKYLERQKKLTGKKKGGKVTKRRAKEDSYQLDANEPNRMGIAPYGLRYALSASEVPTAKGKGYLGEMPSPMGAVTEYSLDDRDIGGYPSVTPNQSREDLEGIKRGKVSDDAYRLARKYAQKRIDEGRSPFAQPDELRYPMPKD